MPRSERQSRLAYAAGPVSTPTSLASYRCYNLDFGPAEKIEHLPSGNIIGFAESLSGEVGSRHTAITFGKEIVPQTGTATAPTWGALLRACGFGETSAGATYNSFIYTASSNLHHPYSASVTDGTDAIDLYVSRGAMGTTSLAAREILSDCVGTCTFNFRAGQRATIDFDFIGRINSSVATLSIASMTDTALTALATEPKPVVTTNGAMTIGGISNLICTSLTFEVGNEFGTRPTMGGNSDAYGDIGGFAAPFLTGRKSVCTLEVEHNPLATANFHDDMVDRSNIAISFLHGAGTGAGSEIQIDYTGNLVGNPEIYNDRGIVMQRLVLETTVGATASYTNPFKLTIKSTA